MFSYFDFSRIYAIFSSVFQTSYVVFTSQFETHPSRSRTPTMYLYVHSHLILCNPNALPNDFYRFLRIFSWLIFDYITAFPFDVKMLVHELKIIRCQRYERYLELTP